MASTQPLHASSSDSPIERRSEDAAWWQEFPWWMVIIGVVIGSMALKILLDSDYDIVMPRVAAGIWATLRATMATFALAFAIGLVLAMAQVSSSVIGRNVARAYVELVRGIPMLPLIFTVALVVFPQVTDATGLSNRLFSLEWRAILALALVYGAYTAEIFRGGIQSVPPGQVEAGRSLGLSRRKTMRRVVLPQAVRTILPPLGNDFIAILKDTSLLSVLGVTELTLRAKLYASSTFQYPETYLALTFTYLVLVLSLSALLSQFEKYMSKDLQGQR